MCRNSPDLPTVRQAAEVGPLVRTGPETDHRLDILHRLVDTATSILLLQTLNVRLAVPPATPTRVSLLVLLLLFLFVKYIMLIHLNNTMSGSL